MNWKNSIVIIVLGLSSTFTFAQSNLLNAKTPDQIGKKTAAELSADNDKPLPYGFVDDRDILMGKMVWEKIQQKDFYTGCGKEDCHWCNFVKNNELAVSLHELEEEI